MSGRDPSKSRHTASICSALAAWGTIRRTRSSANTIARTTCRTCLFVMGAALLLLDAASQPARFRRWPIARRNTLFGWLKVERLSRLFDRRKYNHRDHGDHGDEVDKLTLRAFHPCNLFPLLSPCSPCSSWLFLLFAL